MKTKIYYFSSTGNSLATAKEVAQKLGETELISIVSAMKEGIKTIEADRIGFVAPLYYCFVPPLMKEFIEGLEQIKAKECFSITTCHNPIGYAPSEMATLLKTKGATLNYGTFLPLVDNYVPFFTMPSKEVAQKKAEQARKRAAEIATDILAQKRLIKKIPTIFKPLFILFNKGWYRTRATSDKHFTLNSACTSCTLCEQICPVDNITLTGGIPQWNGGCEACLACIHGCPQKAIHWKKEDDGKGRYRHEGVSLGEILEGMK